MIVHAQSLQIIMTQPFKADSGLGMLHRDSIAGELTFVGLT
jgi:hypothetical protein